MPNVWVRALVGYVWGLLLFLAVAYSFKYALEMNFLQIVVVIWL
jgi:hypothetical protein